MSKNFILSICIPTYNRATYLAATIFSIACQQRFIDTNDVEIIVSDNCSTDNTQQTVLKLIEIHGGKIKYFRNQENILDLNFEKSLSLGSGEFLKLNNDSLKHNENSLDKMIHLIKSNLHERNILFFLNGCAEVKGNVLIRDLNGFIEKVSYWGGWIGAFGIWKNDFVNMAEFSRYSKLQLVQVDVLLRLITSGKNLLINNEILFTSIAPANKGGYNLLTVFLDNYFFILSEEVKLNHLSKRIFKFEKKKILLQFICPWLVEFKMSPDKYFFELDNTYRKIFRHFKYDIFTVIKFIFKFCALFCYRKLKNVSAINGKLKN